MKKNDNIQLLERTYDMTLSDEQKTILTCDFKQPTLISACAGAGKTTLLILSIIYHALEKHTLPQHVMGITFSRKAREDMEARYDDFIARLLPFVDPTEVDTSMWTRPNFVTFHALFLRILKAYDTSDRPYEMANWHRVQNQLYRVIQHPNESLSVRDDLERYMNLRSLLVNRGLSLNGISVNENSPRAQLILRNSNLQGMEAILGAWGYDRAFTDDYIRVISEYNRLKHENHKIDFDDMQTIVLGLLLTRPGFKEIARNYIADVQQLYVDEFQDISYLQWEIITHLFPKSVLDRLVVIGDDDQSIYSFRGSSPEYILNFADSLMDNAQTLHLSTNYRTGGRILKAVVPEITRNVQRLNKPLSAYNPGGTVRWSTRPSAGLTQPDPALDEFIQQYQQSQESGDGNTYAVLTRYNNSLMIATDYLAERGVFASLGSDSHNKILQTNRIYRIITGLMAAFYDDDFKVLQKNANYIGFSRYHYFVNDPRFDGCEKITEFLPKVAQSKIELNWQLQKVQSMVAETTQIMQRFKHSASVNAQKTALQTLFARVKDMTEVYFNYVIQHRYVSYGQEDYQSILTYIKQLTKNKDSYDAFKANEDYKQTQLEVASHENQPKLEAMTLHGAKGLEFDYVVLFGLSNRDLNRDRMNLYEKFQPNLSIDRFAEKLEDAKCPTAMLGQFARNGVTAINRLAFLTFTAQSAKLIVKQLTSLKDSQLVAIDHNGGRLAQEADLMLDAITRHDELMELMYHQVMSASEFVEEERRLLYVGVTRAKQSLVIDLTNDGHNSPLLQELDIPKEDKTNE